MEKELVLQASDIKKTFTNPTQVEVLKNINLSVQAGESVAIIGTSGEGKSTLLHILGTLESADSGQLNIQGQTARPGNRAKIRNESLGFVFQDCHLIEDYTVLQNVLMPLRIARKDIRPKSEYYQYAVDLLKLVGLESRTHFTTKVLSGGERQRVALARALCNRPAILMADEPTGNLDHQTSLAMQDLMLETARQDQMALIVVTHDQELAKRCDTTYQLQDGVLI